MTGFTADHAIGSRGNSWQIMDLLDQAPGFAALSQALIELTDEGVPIVVGTADLKYSNGLVRYQERHPDRFIQFGISEQNMVSAAAGIATTGNQPWVATFASFLALLCAEQIRTDTAYTQLPVRMVGHHAGITLGFYGTSHHATEDLAIMRSIANLTVLAPADPVQLHALVKLTRDIAGPVYLRIGRGRDQQIYDPADLAGLRIGQAVRHGQDAAVTVVATGSMVHPAIEARAALADEGMDVCVLDMHTIKPLDRAAIERAAAVSELIVTVEEHNVLGGLGGAVAEVMAESGSRARLLRHGFHDEYSLIGPPSHLYRHYDLDAHGIAHVVRRASVQPARSGA
ncbi:transketolase family protein [Mycobacterium neglectum]|uniref:transketolase family protein n=1 Tax=Mycobacterium neglectum TaxID=242737 RepID=UPI000BFF132E|nr:transketolase C-terminal domain-containing protein [Mycobacterium neglectum]